MSHTFVAGEASLWVQRNGPNTEPQYLGCHETGDITIPYGDVTLFYCPDPAGTGKFIVRGSVQNAPGNITTTVISDYTDELDELERAQFPMTLFVHKVKRGRRDSFVNRDRSVVLVNARITQRTITGLSSRSPDNNNRSENSYDITAEAVIEDALFTTLRHTLTEANAINGIRFSNVAQPRTSDSVARESGEEGWAVCDAGSGVTANVLHTTNGASWAATSADPFGADEHIFGITTFDVSRDVTRVLVGRGVTDASNPPEIAFSDDEGATWTLVNLGATNADFVAGRHGIFSADPSNIFVVTDLGIIYKSADGGVSWTAKEAGVITSGAAWLAIHFADSQVGWVGGETNFIARTIDGGESWSAVTGPSGKSSDNIISIVSFDRNRAWVGYADGELFYTLNGGVTWSQRSFTGTGTGSVKALAFLNDLYGFLLHDNGTPLGSVHKTIDGGYTWEKITIPTNSGLNDIFIADNYKFFIAGEANASTGFIAKGVA